MYTRVVKIYERNGWRVTSFGRGTAYLLEYGTRSVFLQGDDAIDFEIETMDKDGFFHDHCEERFADYSEIMTEDEQ
jgi:hypothetical protein